MEANSYNDSSSLTIIHMFSWKLPLKDWVKLNIDGSFNDNPGFISVGGVIRDTNKNWVGRFSINICSENAMEVELWAMLEEL
ncbi:hypothetical protein ACOSP7_018996 [Xanthoceras sorbifolium]